MCNAVTSPLEDTVYVIYAQHTIKVEDIIIVRHCIPFGVSIFVRVPMQLSPTIYLFLTSDRISKRPGLVQPLDLKVFHSPSVATPD